MKQCPCAIEYRMGPPYWSPNMCNKCCCMPCHQNNCAKCDGTGVVHEETKEGEENCECGNATHGCTNCINGVR
jgi:hypothetical protein